MKESSTVLALLGFVSIVTGVIFLNNANYGLPPIPTGYIVAMILLIFGTSGIITTVTMITHTKVRMKELYILYLILACMLTGLGLYTFTRHPLEVPNCPCPGNTWGSDCTPCTCVNGICDEGPEGSGVCLCDMGWGGKDCDICADTYQGEQCDECKRGFWKPLEGCKECYPPYTDGPNGACTQCSSGFLTENDDLGLLCRRCQPEHYGAYCKYANSTLCRADGDTLAFAKDDDWQRANVYTGNTCTASGQNCETPYDCESSHNCKGQCVRNDETSGDLCEHDLQCPNGFSCEFKVCCLEKKVADGSCECGRSGYVYNGTVCAKCPGFDGVYSASICSGHGTCAAAYSSDPTNGDIVGLTCVCVPKGLTPFPAWSGESCGCLRDSETGPCVECWDGFFGPTCEACPGGAGISQCNMHGVCNDGLDGDGTCTCDTDVKYRGLGAWAGESCDACANSDFYDSERCWPCPGFLTTACTASTNPFLPNICTTSCGSKTCNVDSGFCEN